MPKDGYEGVDVAAAPGVTHVVNLQQFPWPFADESCEALYSSHLVEHLPDLIGFMNEAHRILKPGGVFEIRHPYLCNVRAFQDPTHVRFIPETTWMYFDRTWRALNKLDHYPITTDFEVQAITGEGVEQAVALRSPDAQTFARQHYWNVVADLFVRLCKRPAAPETPDAIPAP